MLSDSVPVARVSPVPRTGDGLFTGAVRTASIAAVLRHENANSVRVYLVGGEAFDAPTDGGQNAELSALVQ